MDNLFPYVATAAETLFLMANMLIYMNLDLILPRDRIESTIFGYGICEKRFSLLYDK